MNLRTQNLIWVTFSILVSMVSLESRTGGTVLGARGGWRGKLTDFMQPMPWGTGT